MILFLLFFILLIMLMILLFIRTKSRRKKWFFGLAVVLFVAFVSFMVIGLWGMDVEDLYGTKQEIYWDGNSGDTVKLVDDETKVEIARGILKNTWHRIHVKTNNKEVDILGWIEDEIGAYYIESENEIKDGVVTLNMLSGTNWLQFKNPSTNPYRLNIKYIGENLVLYQLTKVYLEKRRPTTEQGIAKFYQAKNDTLFYRNVTKGDTLIVSVFGEENKKTVKMFRKITNKNSSLDALNNENFWQ